MLNPKENPKNPFTCNLNQAEPHGLPKRAWWLGLSKSLGKFPNIDCAVWLGGRILF